MANATSRRASTQDEQIVTEALAIVKMACGDCHPLSVLAFERQALHLALRRSYTRSDIRNRGTRPNGDTLYAVRSDSQPGKAYLVTVHPIAHPTCTCMAGVNQRPCKHSGIALGVWAEERDRARIAAEAGVPVEYWWMTRSEWLDLCEEMYEFHTAQERRAEGRW